jgi:hypothetical protein
MPAQALLKTLLLTSPSFVEGSVTEGDIRVLDSGLTNMCVLYPGSIPAYDTAGMTREHEWDCLADIYTRFLNDTAYSTLGTLRDELILLLDATKFLSVTYYIAGIISDGDLMDVKDKQGGGPYFVTQRLRVTIVEEV